MLERSPIRAEGPPSLSPCAALGEVLRHLHQTQQLDSMQPSIEAVIAFVSFLERRERVLCVARAGDVHVQKFIECNRLGRRFEPNVRLAAARMFLELVAELEAVEHSKSGSS